MEWDKDEHGTPNWLFDWAQEKYKLCVDMAASEDNAKLDLYFTKQENSLNFSWATTLQNAGIPLRVWCNPPYSRGNLPAFTEKFVSECANGVYIVSLLPVDTSTDWWHINVMGRAQEVLLLNTRVQFEGGPVSAGAKFPSCLVIYNPAVSVAWTHFKSLNAKGMKDAYHDE